MSVHPALQYILDLLLSEICFNEVSSGEPPRPKDKVSVVRSAANVRAVIPVHHRKERLPRHFPPFQLDFIFGSDFSVVTFTRHEIINTRSYSEYTSSAAYQHIETEKNTKGEEEGGGRGGEKKKKKNKKRATFVQLWAGKSRLHCDGAAVER